VTRRGGDGQRRADAEHDRDDDGLVAGVLERTIPASRRLQCLRANAKHQKRRGKQLADGQPHDLHRITAVIGHPSDVSASFLSAVHSHAGGMLLPASAPVARMYGNPRRRRRMRAKGAVTNRPGESPCRIPVTN
jgi:hypothetical protein